MDSNKHGSLSSQSDVAPIRGTSDMIQVVSGKLSSFKQTSNAKAAAETSSDLHEEFEEPSPIYESISPSPVTVKEFMGQPQHTCEVDFVVPPLRSIYSYHLQDFINESQSLMSKIEQVQPQPIQILQPLTSAFVPPAESCYKST